MGKNKRRQFDIETSFGKYVVDSLEEVSFIRWCEEAIKYNLIEIDEQFYQPNSWTLFDGYKIQIDGKNKTKLRPHIYSPDFKMKLTCNFIKLFPKIWSKFFWKTSQDDWVYLDVKGRFGNSSGRSFPIDQKWVLAKYNIFVGKIIPEDLFISTWVPEKERYSDKRHIIREKYKNLKTIGEIVGVK